MLKDICPDFENFLKDYKISLLDFMDIYSEFSSLDSQDKLKIIEEYTKLITKK